MDRREFVNGALIAGTAGAFGGWRDALAAEPPPETTRIRLPRFPIDIACLSPLWIAEEMLRAEGFSKIEYLPSIDASNDAAAGKLDLCFEDVPAALLVI